MGKRIKGEGPSRKRKGKRSEGREVEKQKRKGYTSILRGRLEEEKGKRLEKSLKKTRTGKKSERKKKKRCHEAHTWKTVWV